MSKKLIDVMDTTFRDGFQSVFGGRVLMEDFFPALEAAKEAGISHFEFGGGARFQSLFFYLNENAFDMMDKFREIVGPTANLQTLSRGVNTVMLETGSSELINLHAKLFKKHGATTIRNFDALNDIDNLKFSGKCIVNNGLKHEIVITIMDLPPGCKGAHTVEYYEKVLRDILDAEIEFSSLCFKDASGTAHPNKVFETVKMARKLLPEHIHIRLHTHQSAGCSVSQNLAALTAGADGIDLACFPVSGGTSQPDILTLMHATKGSIYDLGGLEEKKILEYQKVLKECLKDYYMPPESRTVLPIIPFSPMPGGALTANTQMMRDDGTLDKFEEVIYAMGEVVEKGGFGTSVTPVSQFYWQQAYANVMFGKWKQITPGYGKMVLGYFGKTPTAPDPEIVKLASEKLQLEPTTKTALELADNDPTKSIKHFEKILEDNNIEKSEENTFIVASCGDKGVKFLKGEGEVNVRKNYHEEISQVNNESPVSIDGEYTVIIDGIEHNLQLIKKSNSSTKPATTAKPKPKSTQNIVNNSGTQVLSQISGNVFKILKNSGDRVKRDEVIIILEAMKMEIDIVANADGIIQYSVDVGQSINEGDLVATIS